MERLFPGVHIEEASGQVKTIAGVSTATAAFVGHTEKGPVDQALPVSSFSEFEKHYGTDLENSFLPYSVLHFFNNGGKRLYVARVPGRTDRQPPEEDYQSAFSLLDSIKDLSIVATPGVGSTSMVSFGASYCERRRDSFFIGELGTGQTTVEEAQEFINHLAVKNSYAALYFPWLEMSDPLSASSGLIKVPPTGFVAGLYARTDEERGVWKAPAGVAARLLGASGPAVKVTDREQEVLNPIGVNVIRAFPTTGPVVWGARTLGTTDHPEYRYVPVRRLTIFLERSIGEGLGWAIFEPNGEPLWARLRQSIEDFMTALYRSGAFQGRTPAEAFFVKCDGETTTPSDIETGRVNILVGFAPLKPAEFIIIRISQPAGRPAA